LKILATQAVISVDGNQKDERNIELGFAPCHRNINCLQDKKTEDSTSITCKQNKGNFRSRLIEPECEIKTVPLDPRVPNKTVTISQDLTPEEEKDLLSFLQNKGSFRSRLIDPECEIKTVPLDPRVPDKTVTISQDLTPEEEKDLLSFLDKNNDVFAWKTSDLIGVSRDIIEHKLEVNPYTRPKKQRLHKMSDEKVAAAKAEVQRLLDVGFLRKVYYPSWLANVVMVKKKNGKWRMFTDFTDLNKSCPNDDFPLTRIDKVVDTATGCEIMALLDCFSGYHQIWLRVEDQEKASFITSFGTYFYLRMPEGPKNVRSTFFRMMKVILREQLERNVFAYVDDIVVANRKKETRLQDLAETFANLRSAQLKLNPEKCVFGVSRGKVLGYLVLVKGIKENPGKVKALICMKPLKSRKEVQKLTGRIATLNLFMAKIAEQSLPFLKVLRGSGTFEWGSEQ
jgi:hypothetical protein